jgi:flagellar basal-body rod protein FlgB
MIDALFNQPNYQATRKLLDATVLRHEALASNLANLETPGYKRLDVAPVFETELRQAVATQDPALVASLRPRLEVDQTAKSSGRDGNTVQLESELLKFNQNNLEHTLETQLVTASLLKLRTAITGRAA